MNKWLSVLLGFGSVLFGFPKKFGEVHKGAVIDGDRNNNPHHIAPHEDEPEVLQLQVAVESWGPCPVLCRESNNNNNKKSSSRAIRGILQQDTHTITTTFAQIEPALHIAPGLIKEFC